MTTPSDDSDPPVINPQSPTREAAECEAGLRRVLAYICEKRYRRWSAYAMTFLVIYASLAKLVSWLITLLFALAIPPRAIFLDPFKFGIALQALDFIPLLITLLIFIGLHRIYKGS